jgi:hypothetical protein
MPPSVFQPLAPPLARQNIKDASMEFTYKCIAVEGEHATFSRGHELLKIPQAELGFAAEVGRKYSSKELAPVLNKVLSGNSIRIHITRRSIVLLIILLLASLMFGVIALR